jgi:hypothetical protein
MISKVNIINSYVENILHLKSLWKIPTLLNQSPYVKNGDDIFLGVHGKP